MHRTRTTTKVLAGMAGVVGVTVAAVTGCVSVEPPPAAPPIPAPAGVGLPAGQAEPQVVVEAPAREALEAVDPPERPAAPPRRQEAPERAHGGSQQNETDRPHEQRERGRSPGGGPQIVLPPVLPKLPVHPPRSRGEVCDIGEKYGGWGRGSDQSRICRDTYGGRG
ncbi:hypothetical protein ABZO31_04155 [Streptomyces sp. HUAS MG47]|uniref:hypothetical protein n=1 Tax=Streptomyces solicamelliae TaxID=3231716 RepID=UPI00387824DC